MVTERTIINGLIIGASLFLVPFVISSTLSVVYGPALFFGGMFCLILGFFFIKDHLCVWPMLGYSITGTLNFLPLPLQAQHVFSIMLILYYISGYVIIKQKPIKLGLTKFLWPILIVTAIVLYHNHSLNVRLAGNESEEGAKPAILLIMVVIAYFCGINVRSPSVAFLSKIPFYCLCLSIISSIPFLLTTLVPSLAPALYYFTDSVNVEAYVSTMNGAGGGGVVTRLGVLGPVGGTLQLYLLCHYPIGTWWRPNRWWVAALSIICMVLITLTGFRNVMFGFLTITLVGAIAYYRLRALFVCIGLFILLVIVQIMAANNVIHLPEDQLPFIAQRTLSFLPGDWDKDALESARVSNEFRKNIEDVYIKEYLRKSPLIGNGFDIDKKEYENLNTLAQRGGEGEDAGYLQAKIFIEGKLFHTGWLSLYDAVGLIGGIAFVVLGWNEIMTAAHFIFGPRADPRSTLYPLYVWILAQVFLEMSGFFTVFGDFGTSFPSLCIYAIVLSQLTDIERATSAPTADPRLKGDADFSRIGGGYYGYPSKT
jgi:energy-coupling factor transporter transmembrane protein EcfT